MNMLTMILGLLVGLVAPILVGVAMAAAKIVSIGRHTLTIKKKALRKTTTTGARAGSTDATVTRMPERKRDAEVRPAA
jgi:acyl-CoA hydrolase